MPVESCVGLRTVEINPWEDSRWEEFVVGHPDGTIYHHPTWLKSLEREYRQRALYLGCEDAEGRLLGILPLLYTRGIPLSGNRPLTGPRLASLPRTPIAGPLSIDSVATAELLREAVRRANATPQLRLQIKAHGNETSDNLDGVIRKPWRLSYVVRLAGAAGQAYTISHSQNRASIKRGINKSISKGVRTRLANSEADLRVWYEFYLETMRRNLVPARPYRLFLALWELMRPKGLMRLVLAEHKSETGSRLIGGHIFFNFGNTVTYAFGASRASDLSLRPNDMILWQAIQEASQEGYKFVDLGEVSESDDDLARFKMKWGAEPVRLYRYYYPDFPDPKHPGSKPAHSPMRLANLIWQRMPLGVTAWVGDRVYGYL